MNNKLSDNSMNSIKNTLLKLTKLTYLDIELNID